MAEYPSNSHASKEAENEVRERKQAPVVKGHAVTKKKSFGQKFGEVFVSEDVGDVKTYILTEVIVPSVKSLISDMVTSGIEMMLYGETRGTNRASTHSKTSYSNYYNGAKRSSSSSRSGRGIYNYEEIIMDTRSDADSIIDNMIEILQEYKQVSVGDLYDLADMDSTWADQRYGWTDLSNACVQRVREGYLIKLPKAREL